MKKISKNSIIVFLVVIFLFFTITAIAWLLFQKEKDLSPETKIETEEETIEGLLKNLTPKEVSPLTEEERAELQETLETLTPTRPRALTEEEQKEIDELLKQLTPQ